MSIRITREEVGDVVVLHVAGRITLGQGTGLFRDALQYEVDLGTKRILLDFSEVSYIDFAGNGEVISGSRTVVDNGGQLKLFHPNKRIHSLLRSQSIEAIFDIRDDEAEAIRSFRR